MSDPDRAAVVARYHALSTHHPGRYAPGPGGLDWATQPEPFRTYAGAPRVDLPLVADTLGTAWADVRAGVRPAPRPFDRASLALLLELSLGLSAWKEYGASRWALRCNPSSGNLHPTEGYLVCAASDGLPAGVHHYMPLDHVLEQRAAPADGRGWGEALGHGVLVGLSGIHWREAWKYGVRAFRYCQHDAGHALAAVAYAAAALGWHARLVTTWSDDEVARLLGLDGAEDVGGAEREVPELLVWLTGDADTLVPPTPEALPVVALPARANRLSPAHVEWEPIDIVADVTHRAPGDPVEAPADWPRPAAALHVPVDLDARVTAAAIIRQRRSAVDFDGRTVLPAAAWFGMLDALLPRASTPPLDAWPWRPRIHPVCFVHRVADVPRGLYVLVRDPDARPRLRGAWRADFAWSAVEGAPEGLPLFCLEEGDAETVARTISCHQDIAAAGAFAVGFVGEFDACVRPAPWRYRALHWEAGLLGQVLYLEAEAAGVRGTGIGCFFDEAMHRLLGIADTAWRTIYHFTVGGPLEDARLRTQPPYAHLDNARLTPLRR